VDEFFSTPFMTDIDLMPLFAASDKTFDNMIQHISPAYRINSDNDKVELIVEVPGVKAKDVTVEFQAGGKVLHISVKRTIKQGNSSVEAKFQKMFSLGTKFDTDKIVANLSDGLLTIVAPKSETEKEVLKIEVTEGPEKVEYISKPEENAAKKDDDISELKEDAA